MRYGYCIGPTTYKFDASFGSVISQPGDMQISIDKSKVRLEFSKALHWNKARTEQSPHTLITLFYDDQDPIKLVHDHEKTKLTFENETERSVTMHYTWKYDHASIDIGRIPTPEEFRIGA